MSCVSREGGEQEQRQRESVCLCTYCAPGRQGVLSRTRPSPAALGPRCPCPAAGLRLPPRAVATASLSPPFSSDAPCARMEPRRHLIWPPSSKTSPSSFAP